MSCTLRIAAAGLSDRHSPTDTFFRGTRELYFNDEPIEIIHVPAATTDEVGQLTVTFNAMTQSLRERSEAITANLETIRKQVTQLTAVHQTSAAITSTLDLHELLDTVLQLLRSNLGFSRMALMLRHEDRDVGYIAQVAGVSDEIAEAARYLTVPAQLLDGQPDTILDLINPVAGNFSIMGGFVGGIVAGLIRMRQVKLPVLPTLDMSAFGLALGTVVGRIGDLAIVEHLRATG